MKVLLGIAFGFVLQLHAQVAQLVGVVASDPEAREISPLLDIPENPAVFQVWRHGPTNGPLTVLLSVGGTASNGVDYEFISNSVTIPAGSLSTEIFVSVIDDQIAEGTETVVLTLQPSPCLACYEVGSNSTAIAYILDDEAINAPPIVWISRPHDGESFVGPTNILLRAVAHDPDDGYDISVEFFSGDDRIGAATFIPSLCPAVDCPSWDLVWSNVPPGTYTLRAKATDKAGAMTVSAPVHITVISNGSPRIVIVTPHEGDGFPAGTNIFLGANPFADSGVERVDFYDNHAFIGRGIGPLPGAIAAYGLTWSNPAAGSHTLLAVVTDGNGAKGTSAPVHVTIFASGETNLPVVTVTAIAASTEEDEALRGAPLPPIGFNVFRSGPTNDALTVRYEMGGTAINGVDYTALPGVVQIPAGRSNVLVVAHPIDDLFVEGSETVTFRLRPDDCGPVPLAGSVSITGQGTTGPGGWNLAVLAEVGTNGTNGHIEVLGGAACPVTQVVPPHEGFDCWCINARRTDVTPTGPDYRENVYIRDTGDGITTFDKFGLISSIGGDCNSFSIDDLFFLSLSQGDFKVVASDTDADGVPDYADLCPDTAPGSVVDEHGCHVGQVIPCGRYRVGEPGQATMLILDNDSDSEPISLIPTGSVWKYYDQCVDLGTAWRSVEYNDAAWASGPAQLGYGDGDEATVISSGPDPSLKCITDYFRRQLVITNVGAVANLRARLVYDDGAVVYLNGVEVFRVNMPDGPVRADTLAAAVSEDNAVFTANIDPALLVNGINVVAVEVHQANVLSSDLSFDFELQADLSNSNGAPHIVIVTPHEGESFPAGSSIFVGANPSAERGVQRVDFYSDNTFIGQGLGPLPSAIAAYGLSWSNPAAGTHALTAVVTDNAGAKGTSAPVHVVIGPSTNLSPIVAITAPTNGAVVPAGTDLHIEAVTMDPDGYADTVAFFADNHPIGEVTILFIQAPPPGSPINFEFTWTNPPPGGHVLTAATADALGARGTSAPVRIFVTAETNRPPDYTVVTVVALDSHAQEPGLGAVDTGQFAIWRTGNLSNDVTVFFGVGGSASNGSDYVAISNRVVIPAGETQAVVNIEPLADALVEGTETVVLELHPPVCAAVFPPPPGCYVVGSPGRATASIADSSAPTNRPPMVELVNPPDGSIFPALSDILLIAHANDPDGYETVRSVEFFVGSNSLGIRTNYATANPIGPFFLIWSNVLAGEYALTARATDSAGASTSAAPIHVRVVDVTATNRPSVYPWPRLRIPPQCLAEVRTNGCRLLLGADTPMTCVLESTVDLLHWKPLCTNTLSSGEIELRDCESGGAPMRFYRVRQQ